MSEINIPLMRKVLEHITAHPDEHDQDTWGSRTECGTTHCMAGWAVQFAGGELLWGMDDYEDPNEASTVLLDGRVRVIEYVAAEVLGLSGYEAGRMFWASTISDLWGLAEEFTGGEVRRP